MVMKPLTAWGHRLCLSPLIEGDPSLQQKLQLQSFAWRDSALLFAYLGLWRGKTAAFERKTLFHSKVTQEKFFQPLNFKASAGGNTLSGMNYRYAMWDHPCCATLSPKIVILPACVLPGRTQHVRVHIQTSRGSPPSASASPSSRREGDTGRQNAVLKEKRFSCTSSQKTRRGTGRRLIICQGCLVGCHHLKSQ